MKPEIQDYVKKGKIIIYPTDTTYGIGMDATNSESVKVLRKLKKGKKLFSIIVRKIWIRIPKHPFTLEILKSTKPSIATSVNET